MGERSHRRKRSLGAFAAMLVVWIFGATDCLADPFGDPVKYPRIPALIIAEVKVDGEQASMHDTVAAFVGGELRGKAKVTYSQGIAYVALMVNVDSASNTATIKLHDADNDNVLQATLAGGASLLVIPAGTVGSGGSPALIEASTETGDEGTVTSGGGAAPFGETVQYPQIPTVVIAKVNINGQPAADGDRVAVFVGEELRGKGVVVVSGGIAYSAVTVNVSEDLETATFQIWDHSASETLNAYINTVEAVSISPGGSVGTWTVPVFSTQFKQTGYR